MGKTGPKRTVFLEGQTFGRLTVIREVENHRSYVTRLWLCRCECGNVTTAQQVSLRNGSHRSCGCLQREVAAITCNERNTTHALAHTPEYEIWCGIIKRCENPSGSSWHLYGERGISVCERWRNSFEAFLADVGERPSAKHSIDRYPNNNGNYEPGNVRWATRSEQQRNKRNNRLLTFNGQTATLAEWSEQTGRPYAAILARLDRFGWSVEDALTVPVKLGQKIYKSGLKHSPPS